jgi:hypothetical protein
VKSFFRHPSVSYISYWDYSFGQALTELFILDFGVSAVTCGVKQRGIQEQTAYLQTAAYTVQDRSINNQHLILQLGAKIFTHSAPKQHVQSAMFTTLLAKTI